ncbi:hypothetical protein EC9_54540 [Rosistilla ulvae]|uniref:Uncharacterized protein n=1 Tax=Rosistilla ulvae TaxID=1930277 RepID=A0A517M8M4_9BACT|nr:hypothetical protein [Rosistilla ulvae]QDS91230.1 hypothetical protein EC9_54540 [Rosistilla ulvae]
MKFNVKFQIPRMSLWNSIFGKRLDFTGKGDVNFQETAIVVCGDLPKFRIPFISQFYTALLTERTTRTVPYARITKYRTTGRWVSLGLLKILFLLLWFLGVAGLLFAGMEQSNPVLQIVLGILGFVIVPLIILMFGRATHYVTYSLPSGKQSQFACRVAPTSSENMEMFSNRLTEYQTAATAFAQTDSTGATTS